MLFHDEVRIAAPAARIFAFFCEMEENYTRWHPDHQEFRWLTEGGLREGAVSHFVERIGGKVLTKDVVYTRVEPDRYIEFTLRNRLYSFVMPRLSFRILPDGDGCRFVAEIYIRTGPIGAWLNRHEFAAVRVHMREEAENLKQLMEHPVASTAIAF